MMIKILCQIALITKFKCNKAVMSTMHSRWRPPPSWSMAQYNFASHRRVTATRRVKRLAKLSHRKLWRRRKLLSHRRRPRYLSLTYKVAELSVPILIKEYNIFNYESRWDIAPSAIYKQKKSEGGFESERDNEKKHQLEYNRLRD